MLPAGSAHKNRFFCLKFCSDSLILLGIRKKFSALCIVFIFAIIGRGLGLTPKH